MANIQQAAKWMQEGKSVKRPHHGRLGPSGNFWPIALRAAQGCPEEGMVAVCVCHGARKAFSLDSLIADDWEIAE